MSEPPEGTPLQVPHIDWDTPTGIPPAPARIGYGLTWPRRKVLRRFHWWDRSLWWRSYREGGFDGYRTLTGRRLPCDTMLAALTRPGSRAEIRRLSSRRWN